VTDKKTVLLVSVFHPELVRGGAQQICYELFEGLRDEPDYNAVLLASVDNKFPALFKSGARITGFDERPNEFLFLSRDYDHWWHRLPNPLLLETYADFLGQIKPDIVHFHHFLTFGVELISLTRRVLPNARIVFTFHEFLAICTANGHMVRPLDNSLCRSASQVRCHQCFPEHSPEDFFLRRLWLQAHFDSVDAFVCPSRYMIDHYADWGIDRNKLFHVTNGQRDYARRSRSETGDTAGGPRNRFGFFGQMVDAKGVHILLRAVDILRAEGFDDFTIEINGDNDRFASPEVRGEIEGFLKREAELPESERRVRFNGSYDVHGLAARMARVDWVIVPSIWWEAFVLVISEAWMFGKPVICSNIGAMADRVTDGVDGLHFEMGSPAALARAIRRTATEPGLWDRLSAGVPQPPSREEMVAGYRRIYDMAGGNEEPNRLSNLADARHHNDARTGIAIRAASAPALPDPGPHDGSVRGPAAAVARVADTIALGQYRTAVFGPDRRSSEAASGGSPVDREAHPAAGRRTPVTGRRKRPPRNGTGLRDSTGTQPNPIETADLT
jgi:glycosyltransferase involved in cell wall biosynthesis